MLTFTAHDAHTNRITMAILEAHSIVATHGSLHHSDRKSFFIHSLLPTGAKRLDFDYSPRSGAERPKGAKMLFLAGRHRNLIGNAIANCQLGSLF